GGDERVQQAGVVAPAGEATQIVVQRIRVTSQQLGRRRDPQLTQISGDGGADVRDVLQAGDFFPAGGRSCGRRLWLHRLLAQLGRLACSGTATNASPARTRIGSRRSTQPPSPTVAVAKRPRRLPVPGSILKTETGRPASTPSR